MRVNKLIASEISRKTQGWFNVVFIIFALGFNGHNFLINGSIASFVATCNPIAGLLIPIPK